MSRLYLYLRSLGTGYAVIAANAAYTLASIPLALSFLSVKQFGVWVVVQQITGALQLLEMGMAGASVRFLIDEKDRRASGRYSAMFCTLGWGLALAGVVATLLGVVAAALTGPIFSVPPELHYEYMALLAGQSILTGVGLAARILGVPMVVHQRQDLANFSFIGLFIILFGTLWLGFLCHLGIYALLFSSACGTVWGILYAFIASAKFGWLPVRREWNWPDRDIWREVFPLSRDTFLVQVGGQLVSLAPLLIVSRVLGLDAAAAWSIASRPFLLLLQLLSRIYDFCFPAFTEMFVRGESERLLARYRQIIQVTAAFALVACASLAALNGRFVEWWTHQQINWPVQNQIVMALLVALYAIGRCYGGIVGITKEYRLMRFSALVEALVLIGLGLWAARWMGPMGVLLAAIIANLAVSFPYSIYRLGRAFALSPVILLGWLGRGFLAGVMVGLAAAIVYQFNFVADTAEFFMLAIGLGIFSLPVIWFFGLAKDTRAEILQLGKKEMRR